MMWFLIGVFSTIGGIIPEVWGDSFLSFSSILLSGAGAFLGLWLWYKITH
jgi:hypothetical protein